MTGLIQDGIDRGCDRSPTFSWREHRRKLRFLLVGALCFMLQYAVLRALSGAGMARPVANGVGFVISAQANFVLSSAFTWADRWSSDVLGSGISRHHLNVNGRRWVSYNGTAAVALAVNTVAFTVADRVLGALPAALAGVAAGTVVTYLICDRLIFAAGATRAARAAGAAQATHATQVDESLQESVS
jgi:putative flippase GtrA